MNIYLLLLIVPITLLNSYTDAYKKLKTSAQNVFLTYKGGICNPPCQNGGNCLSFNTCQCPQEFRGPQCQYRASACSASRLNFNGIHNCSEKEDEVFSCFIACPERMEFQFPPEYVYVCDYATGTFMPEHVPHCVFDAEGDPVESIIGYNYDEYDDQTQFYNATSSSILKKGLYGKTENRILENKPQPGSCFIWSGSHFKTFDGKVFSFASTCAHTLVRDRVDNTFSIIVQNSKGCLNKLGDCYTIIKIYLQDKEYILQHRDDGAAIFSSGNRILPVPGRVPGIRTEAFAHYIYVFLDSIGAKLKWDGQQLVQVEVKETLWNKTSGLCGRIDGDSNNDMLMQDNNLPRNVATLARSWQVHALGEACEEISQEKYACEGSKAFKAGEFCEQLFSDKRFALCQQVMDLTVLLSACVWDYCSCKHSNSEECACETLNVYVRECAHKGVTALVKWRDKHTCPIRCNGGRVYMPCAPAGGQALCGGVSEKLDEVAECEEGCYCPEGMFLHSNSKCIAKEECPCLHRGKDYRPGSSIPKECNTCTCSDGKWICTQLTCGTRCSVIGDPHYTTFDGKHYDFMGQCTYTLVEHNNFSIETENVPCGGAIAQALNLQNNLPSCPKTVTIKIAGNAIKVKQGREVSINGQEVPKLPFHVSGATIRVASSMFLVVELLDGVAVWWDGVTRVHVDVAPSFIGQTKGLCGTFNENQKDDFLTPEGDVEQSAIPFANKWKTTEMCDDVSEKVYSHPCDVNIQNKALAEEHCNIIKSKLFADCNGDVDPETFYQDCLYDLCSCDTKLTKCLCPMVAAFAEECARKGININWRTEATDCGLQCASGQKYYICGNSCTRSCYDIAMVPDCKQRCVEGCNCPEGETIDELGECIPIGQCSCQHDGLEYPAGYNEIRTVDGEPELCICINAVWSCRPATQKEIAEYPKINDTKAMCHANMEFTTCEPVEPITCKNMHSPELVSNAVCHAGCQCKEGYVLDGFSKTCVKPTECPCHHSGSSYSENSAIQNDCNTCTCKHGKWQCTHHLCPGECSAWGDSHYKTFDGKLYDYQGQCDYMLVKGTLGDENAFDISIQNVPCGSLGVSCSKSISIRVGSPPNQEIITLTRGEEIPEHAMLEQLILHQRSHFVIVEAPELKFLVRWDKGTRVYVKLDTMWKNKVKGLCGNYNDNQLDDFQTPYGGIAEVSPLLFGDSWRLQPFCPKALDITNTCEDRPERKVWALKRCGILKSSVFASCHSEVPLDSYLERCIFDTCACDQGGDCECLCTALAAYAQECNSKGIPIKWRTPDLCPMQCDERCTNYNPCISTCSVETCDNTLVHGQLKNMCEQDTCIEGCQAKPCPLNFIYLNSSLLDCVPRNICRPICLVIDGVEYYEGDVIEEDSCYTCHCSRGRKHCQGEPCVTPIQIQHPEVKCQPGWTEWINQDETSSSKIYKEGKATDIEPLPESFIMNNLKGKSHCETQDMVDIECRTVKTHLSYKETGLDVECSLERGLICRSKETEKACVDFEIRVKCECERLKYTKAPPIKICDVSQPSEEHSSNCRLYYKCEYRESGPEMVAKACGSDMLFNPRTLQCDSAAEVIKIKPHCSKPPERVSIPPPTVCATGQELHDCSVQCHRLCMYYSHQVQNSGHCLHGKACEKGCVSNKRKQHSCPPGMFWANSRTCIAKKDCMCVSHDGTPVKPGEIINESDCEVCQCIDNYYACDKSACPMPTETMVPPVTVIRPVTSTIILPIKPCDVSQSRQEHLQSCDLYYECKIGKDGPELLEKACASNKMYNPITFECDFPEVVIEIKPHCFKKPVCPVGQEFRDCSVQCRHLCMYYSYQVQENGQCLHNKTCEKGCVSKRKQHSCPPGMYWANNLTCVAKKDCTCVSHNGKPVIPGEEVQESNCEVCYCIDNYYKCDKSACPTHVPAVVEEVSTSILITPTASTPPGECSKENFINLIDGDIPLGDEAFTASSTLSSEFAPKFAHLSSKTTKQSGSWMPQTSDKDPYLQIDMGRQEAIYGIITEGSPLQDQYITSYTVLYSPDAHAIFSYLTDHHMLPKTFRGSSAGSMPSKHIFDVPIEAQIVRIKPEKWHNAIALRVELLGCSQLVSTTQPTILTTPALACIDSMGLDNAMMADQQVSVSSELKPHHGKDHLKISAKNAWQPITDSPSEWVQFDFLEPRNITGFVSRGGHNGWVTEFNVKYSHNGKVWNPILNEEGHEQIFLGNVDGNMPHTVNFELPIQTTLLKITPTKWHQNIQLRIEPLGCFSPYPSEILTTTTEAPSTECNNCPGVFTSDFECRCKEDLWWDGENCVAHAYCPCVVGHRTYAVSKTFESEDCSQCLCKIGGVSHCKPKVCNECGKGLQSVVTNTCTCVCRPCADGTRLCPTSNICINEADWCNGVKDCPDDETGCFVTPATTPAFIAEEQPSHCLEPKCPDGYKLVLKKPPVLKHSKSGLNTMFTSGTKTGYTKTGHTKGIKGGHKTDDKQREITPTETVAKEECILFACVAVVTPPKFPGTTIEPCPEFICPYGYTLELDDAKEFERCPSYECIPTPPPDVICNITGRSFNTFDLTNYKYDICNHILARDLENHQWKISIKNNCTFVCTRNIIIHHEDHTFVLHSDLLVEYIGFKYTVEQINKIGSHSQFFEVNQIGDTIVFISKLYGFWVSWDKQTNAKIGVTADLLEKVDGLCGYFNDNPKDDKRMPDGTQAMTSKEFGDSWVEPGKPALCEASVCPAHIRNKAWEMCNLVKQKMFESCARAVDADAFALRCLETTCTCLEAAVNDEAEDKCRCSALQAFVVDCLTANSDLEVIDWRMKLDCPVACRAPLVHHDCYRRRCEPSCGVLSSNACPQLDHVCFPGCYCPPGYVRKGQECVLPSTCRDCECNVLPHLEYVSYDEGNFTVNGKCVYVMSRDVADPKNKEHKFQVLIRNNHCEHKIEKTCVREVTILYKGHKIDVVRDGHHKKLQLLADSEKISDFEEVAGWAQVKQDRVKHLRILLTEIQVLVSVYYPSLGVSIKASSFKFGGNLEGLCGNCDGDKDNDRQTPKGAIVSDINELALSWLYDGIPGGQSKESCVNHPEEHCEEIPSESHPCSQLENSEKFGECHPVLSPGLFIEWCKKDTCNAHPKHACEAIEAYSYECGHLGFCIDWRTQLCPAKQCPDGQEFKPCAPACSQTCEALKEEDQKCTNAPMEGCFCPKGKVSVNDTCVAKERCEPCDDMGHYSGDSWHRDPCTKCRCEGSAIQCETKNCPSVDTICEDGFTVQKISKEDECCYKFVCVQVPPSEFCESAQPIKCGIGQIAKSIKTADGCQQYVCECIPVNDCEPLNMSSTYLKPGFTENIDKTGCCPVMKQSCKVELCPKPPSCPKFHSEIKLPLAEGECCPEYSCLAPQYKCIVDLAYIADEKGGERPRNEFEKIYVLKEADERWSDGPCRECQCTISPSGDYYGTCTVTECPTLTDSIVHQDYVLEAQPVLGQCCASIKKVACKHKGESYKVGEKWSVDPCTAIECVDSTFGIQKVTHVTSCDSKCELGWEYQPASHYSKECCGSCKPVACVADEKFYKPGDEWSSPDHCTNYYCSSINGSIQIESVTKNCSELSNQLLKDYDVEIIVQEGECCKSHKIVACKVGNEIYKVGETWPSPDGDKCKNIICTENKVGEIIKQESVETCYTNCSMGWKYKESTSKCCGECVQEACVVDNQLKVQGENWTSLDGCTIYFCDLLGDQLGVIAEQESCPNVDECAPEHIYTKGCCRHCKVTPEAQVTCGVQTVNPTTTVGLVVHKHHLHGECSNTEALEGFTECVGNCKSFTSFNPQTGQHESVCSCCQVRKHKTFVAKLRCKDGEIIEISIDIPSKCGCEDCVSNIPNDVFGKTGVKAEKRRARFVTLSPATCYPPKATVGVPYVLTPYLNSVRSWLDSTEEGTIIKNSYGYGKEFLRINLCNLIIKNEFKNSSEKRLEILKSL